MIMNGGEKRNGIWTRRGRRRGGGEERGVDIYI